MTTINGTEGNDVITGTANSDEIYGLGGLDNIDGGGGNDIIQGGDGADTIKGDAGDDVIDGGEGNDTIQGGADNDTIQGGVGADFILGEDGDDIIDLGEGVDYVIGGSGNDVINGGSGIDTAAYAGNLADYTILETGYNKITVQDDRSGSPEGTDTLLKIEIIAFADGERELQSLIPQSSIPTPSIAIKNATSINTSKSIFDTPSSGELFFYYIHPGGDVTNVGFDASGSTINQQTLDSSAYESFIVSLFDQIDAVIDLDFARQFNNNGSAIDIYAVADDGTNKVGTTYYWNSWFDIDFEITGDNAFEQHIVLHELGHVLGLDHPFDNGFDARYTVDDTVMSYNEGSSGWKTYFTDDDLLVLKDIWGEENDVDNSVFVGGLGGGGGGGGGTSATPVATPAPAPVVNLTPSTEVPTQASISPVVSVVTTQQPNLNSPVLGIGPQAVVSSIELETPLVIDTLQLTQAVVGTVGSDVITGSDAAEVLAGGQGKDKISGGAGADGFLFEQPGEFGKNSRDTITDFNPDEGDKVMISRKVFDGIDKVKLKVVAGKKNAKNADTEDSTFIYDDKKGILFFNENLDEEGWGDGGVFARLKGAPELVDKDFTLV